MWTSLKKKTSGAMGLGGGGGALTLFWALPLGTPPSSHSEDPRKIPSWLWQGEGKVIM